jgi:hypothetical protein
MIIKFKKLTFKNLLSFGATPTTIEFENGVNLISGVNGSGKCVCKKTNIKVQMDEKIYEKYIDTKGKK